MPLMSYWNNAPSPNYKVNKDKIYPYSEVPFIGAYKLVKIPQGEEYLELVDYWGEGRINSDLGISGFSDCYNINGPSQTVSNGPDKGAKIPNRVPVRTYTDCDTSSYVQDNCALTVTLMGSPINKRCAKDIARIVNKKLGKVVVFGFNRNTADVNNLETELSINGFVYCYDFYLPDLLKGLTLFDSFKNISEVSNHLREDIIRGTYENAVELAKTLAVSSDPNIIQSVVRQLFKESNSNIINFAYKLWNDDGQKIVSKYFPSPLKLIFNEDEVVIMNKKDGLALKLGVDFDSNGDKMAWGDSSDKTSNRVCWKLLPVWDNGRVCFHILNVDCGMFLKLVVYRDSYNDREAFGDYSSGAKRMKWYLDPVVVNEELLFFIVNSEYGLGLKLDANPDNIGDRQLWGHFADVHNDPNYFGWYIKAWK